MHSFYIYYKIEAALGSTAEAAAQAAVMRLFAELKTVTGTDGRLLKRADDACTWMEVYEGISNPEHFQAALEAATLNSGLLSLTVLSKRHIEHFRATDLTGS